MLTRRPSYPRSVIAGATYIENKMKVRLSMPAYSFLTMLRVVSTVSRLVSTGSARMSSPRLAKSRKRDNAAVKRRDIFHFCMCSPQATRKMNLTAKGY